MKKIRVAIFGTGFMGRVHLEALRRIESVEPVAINGRNPDSARKLGKPFGVPYADTQAILDDSSIDAVHVCTPNAFHYPIAKAALLAGKHVLCEKPIAVATREAQELVDLTAQRGLRAALCHNLRYYPLVQQMRQISEDGDLGEILMVQGSYVQDWLLYDTDWNWRVDSKIGGPLRCMADVGSHWFDAAEHITGLRVTSLCADFQTFHPIRKQPKFSVETFANKTLSADDYIPTPVDTEDFGSVLFHLGGRARGAMTASQACAGRKNRLSIEIYGTKAGLAWDQERPNELWIGYRDTGNQIIIKDPSLLKPSVRAFADLPGGHAEGYDDTFKQLFRRFYASIQNPDAPAEYPHFTHGVRQMNILEAEMQSNRERRWVNVPAS